MPKIHQRLASSMVWRRKNVEKEGNDMNVIVL
jgi:hypothetical protein